MDKIFTLLLVMFGFLLLGVIMVASTTNLFYTNQTSLYCINTSGNITTNCTQNATLYLNESLVCTATNGLCNGSGGASAGGGWTNTSTVTSTALNVNITSGTLTVVPGVMNIGNSSIQNTPATGIERMIFEPTTSNAAILFRVTPQGTPSYTFSSINPKSWFSLNSRDNNPVANTESLDLIATNTKQYIISRSSASLTPFNISFAALDGTTLTERVHFDMTNGRVGIGTESPDSPLTVYGAAPYIESKGSTYGSYARFAPYEVNLNYPRGVFFLGSGPGGSYTNGAIWFMADVPAANAAPMGMAVLTSNENSNSSTDRITMQVSPTIASIATASGSGSGQGVPIEFATQKASYTFPALRLNADVGQTAAFGTNTSSDAQLLINNKVSSAAGLVVVGASGQSDNLQEWQNSATTILSEIDKSGQLGLNTTAPTRMLDVNSNRMRLRQSSTPASASAPCYAGDMAWDANYTYVCTALNTWKRAALATW